MELYGLRLKVVPPDRDEVRRWERTCAYSADARRGAGEPARALLVSQRQDRVDAARPVRRHEAGER